jgi:hypothetical protein
MMGAGGVLVVSASPVVLQRVLIANNSVGTGAGGMGLIQAAGVSMRYVIVANNKVRRQVTSASWRNSSSAAASELSLVI